MSLNIALEIQAPNGATNNTLTQSEEKDAKDSSIGSTRTTNVVSGEKKDATKSASAAAPSTSKKPKGKKKLTAFGKPTDPFSLSSTGHSSTGHEPYGDYLLRKAAEEESKALNGSVEGETKSPSSGFISWIIENDEVPKCTKEGLMEWWNSLVLKDGVPKLPITDVPKVWDWAQRQVKKSPSYAKVTSKASKAKAVPKVSASATAKATAKSFASATAKASAKAGPKASAKAAPKASAKAAPKASAKAAPKASAKAGPKASASAAAKSGKWTQVKTKVIADQRRKDNALVNEASHVYCDCLAAYKEAVKEHGADSPQALKAKGRLEDATDIFEATAARKARNKKTHPDQRKKFQKEVTSTKTLKRYSMKHFNEEWNGKNGGRIFKEEMKGEDQVVLSVYYSVEKNSHRAKVSIRWFGTQFREGQRKITYEEAESAISRIQRLLDELVELSNRSHDQFVLSPEYKALSERQRSNAEARREAYSAAFKNKGTFSLA